MNKFDQPRTRNILVEVDVQNDFITGSLAVPGGEAVVEPLNQLAEAIRTQNGTVVATRDWHPATTPHFADYGGVWPVHCVAETDGAAFHPDLALQPEDIILSKGMGQTDGYSGWEGIDDKGNTLETIIAPTEPYEKVRVFVGGLATDYCVRATAIDIAKNFTDDERVTTYLLRDAVRGVELHQGDTETALAEIEAAGVITTNTRDSIAESEK